jgi:hypothetical protein
VLAVVCDLGDYVNIFGNEVCRGEGIIIKPLPILTPVGVSPADAYGADGIQFIRIIKDFRLQSLRGIIAPEAMGSNTMNDGGSLFLRESRTYENRFRTFTTELCVAFACGIRFIPCDVMEKRRGIKYFEVCALIATDVHAQVQDTPCVAEIVRWG